MSGRHRIGRTLALPRSRGARWLVITLVLALAAGAGIAAPTLVERLGRTGNPAADTPAPVAIPRLALQPVNVDAPIPRPAAVAARLDPLLTGDALGTVSGRVVDAATGRVLWSANPRRAVVPASVAKLLTAAAALLALDHQARLTTRVVAGARPGTVVLVGGGDPTLTALDPGRQSVYPQAARVGALAARVRATSRRPVRRVLVDTGRYTGPQLAPGWSAGDVPAGFVAPIEPVMLDGGRSDPTAGVNSRSPTPALDAGAELARRLGADPAATALAPAPPRARVLAAVRSRPVEDLVATLLRTSDNVLAEALARQVARAEGFASSFAGSAAAVRQVLTTAGFDLTGARTVDGSGLSPRDRLPARLVARVLAAAAEPTGADPTGADPTGADPTGADPTGADPRIRALRPLLAGLAVAGGTGTLATRYRAAAVDGAAGWVRAKTGTLTGVRSLAGVVPDTSGRLLVFAVLANDAQPGAAETRLDRMAARLRSCGCG